MCTFIHTFIYMYTHIYIPEGTLNADTLTFVGTNVLFITDESVKHLELESKNLFLITFINETFISPVLYVYSLLLCFSVIYFRLNISN